MTSPPPAETVVKTDHLGKQTLKILNTTGTINVAGFAVAGFLCVSAGRGDDRKEAE